MSHSTYNMSSWTVSWQSITLVQAHNNQDKLYKKNTKYTK